MLRTGVVPRMNQIDSGNDFVIPFSSGTEAQYVAWVLYNSSRYPPSQLTTNIELDADYARKNQQRVHENSWGSAMSVSLE